MTRSSKPQISLVLPEGLKRVLINACSKLGCSQGELVRTALWEYFKGLSLLTKEVKGEDHEKVD